MAAETATQKTKINVIAEDEEENGSAPETFTFDFHEVEDEPLPPPKRPLIQRIKRFFGMGF